MNSIKMIKYLFLSILLGIQQIFGYENVVLKPGNHLFITDEINIDSRELFQYNNQMLNETEIYIYINSNGGSVLEGNKIIENINFLANSGYNVSCIAQNAYSMAFHILQHCPNRYITQSATVMQHQISLGVHGNFENIKSYISMLDQLNQKFILHSAKRINISIYEFQSKILSDWWIYGNEIIHENIADKVVTVGCSKELYALIYKKEKKEIDPINFLLGNKDSLELNGCPLLH